MATSALWDGLSLDARTWPTVPIGPLSASLQDKRRLRLACGLSALLIVIGAGFARWDRPSGIISPRETSQAPATPRISDRTLPLSSADGLLGALVANGVPTDQAQAIAATAQPAVAPTGELRAALQIAQQGDRVRFVRLEISNPDGSGAIVSPAGSSFALRRVAAELHSGLISRKGVMDGDSFYSSAVAAGITDSLIPEIAKALSFDFDFQRDIHRGDRFEAAFEQDRDTAGDPIGPPRLLFAAIATAARSASVYRFTPAGGSPGWYDAEGRSIIRALMRTPVDGARVSSTFGMRLHPVLGFMKLHKGIDFAAATGTPVYAAGNAKVEHAAMTGTAGNMIKLRHDNGWETVYMHLNRIMPDVIEGGRVSQGQEIGEVGTTGRSTGPHLHYEVHVGGEPVDPATIATDASTTPPLAGKALAAFQQIRDRIDLDRTRNASTHVAGDRSN